MSDACHRHPDRASLVSCARCRRPLCQRCAVSQRWGDIAADIRETVCRGACPDAPGKTWWFTPDGQVCAAILGLVLVLAFGLGVRVVLGQAFFLITGRELKGKGDLRRAERQARRDRKNQAIRRRHAAEAARQDLEGEPLALDLSRVAPGQRYVFDRGDFEEVWTIEEAGEDGVAYAVAWVEASGVRRDRGRDRWSPPASSRELRRFVRLGAALQAFSVAGGDFQAAEITTRVTRTSYAIRDGRIAFPGVLREEFLGNPGLTRELLRVENP